MRRFVVFGILLLDAVFVFGQGQFSLSDTIQIKEVISYGSIQKYQSGVKFETIPSSQLRLVQEGGINQVLSRFTSIYIKSDAGGLSTIHFRGTSPDHTAINFGGINVNSITLGHSNMSNIPSFLFDEITIQYGSSSTVNGSGAVGGALYLGLSNEWTDGLKVQAKTTFGSFGEYLLGAKVFTGNGRWESVTRIYGYQKENNFPFTNHYTGNVENPKPIRDIQNGASLKNFGFIQELNYRFSQNNQFKSSVWLQNNWYQVQPNMPSNLLYNGTDEIEDNSIRIWTEYVHKLSPVNFKAGAGYVHDLEIYNHLKSQQVETDRLIGELEISSDYSSGLGWKAGSKYQYILPNVYAYSDSVIDFEQRFDFYFSAYYQILPQFKLTINLRQALVTTYSVPFTPSFGGEYVLRSGDYSILKFTSAVAKSYRVPTFNDRYWGTQGNPNLKPEDGNNVEGGGRFIWNEDRLHFEIGVNAFYMKIKNWIEWRNFGVEWKAKNVLEVVSKGVEFQLKTSFPIGNLEGDLVLNYTINPVEAKKTEDENGITGRQLNYVPLHMGNGWFILNGKHWRFFSDSQLTGKRFTDDFGNTLPANFITNTGITYFTNIHKHSFDISLSANNIFNVDYQNERYYAMPGRYFRLSMVYEFKKINN